MNLEQPVVGRLGSERHDALPPRLVGGFLIRLAGLSNAEKARIVAEVCRDRASELLQAFSVVSPGQVRIRRALGAQV
jgi:hypothetical protein